MRTIKVKKLFNNCISIRDYDVRKGIKGGGLIVELEKDKMFLFPNDLLKGKKTGLKIRSRWGNQIYELIDFPWFPHIKKPLQSKLFA